MELDLKTRDEIVQEQATVTQASAAVKLKKLLNFAVGTVLRAVEEAVAGIALWLQGLIVKVLSATRLGTSVGNDVDTFLADYGLERLAAVKSSGNVTFSRTLTATEAVIPIETTFVQTALTAVRFAVIADTTNPDYDPVGLRYIIPVGQSSISAKVEAVIAGIDGNVDSNAVTIFFHPVDYVDYVTNALPFVNGEDRESAAAARIRFVLYINSLSKATKLAISSAIANIQAGIEYGVVEKLDYDTGLERLGYLYVVIDDGTGSPPPSLLATVTSVVGRVRAFTTMFVVYAAIQQLASVTAVAYIDEDLYDPVVVKAEIEVALTSYIDSLAIGNTLHYTKLIDIIYDVNGVIQNVTGVTLNGGTSDLVSDNKHSIKTGTLSISVVSV